MIEAFPLQWPSGYQRTIERKQSSFRLTAAQALADLQAELKLLADDVKSIVVSSNVPVKKNGDMYSDIANDDLSDPGVAVYFMYNGSQVVLCADAWVTPAENVRAIGLAINALRGLGRWKVSDMLNRAFTGFKALPESITKPWWQVLQLSEAGRNNRATIELSYKTLAKSKHPDMPFGSHTDFTELQAAYTEGMKQFK
ncbi:MAG: hypothetical protein ABIQ88_02275 [Chitinophagaceae bacterium]